jgi:membrane protein
MAKTERGRGRRAERPSEIPRQGWRDVLLRVKDELKRDNISIVAAGVAFFFMLSIFPAIAAAVAIWGFVADPATIEQQLQTMAQVLPEQAYQILNQQLTDVASSSGGALSLAALGGILFALWSAGKGTRALVQGLNIAYNEEEERGFVKLTALVLGLTLGAIVFGLIVLTLVAAMPAVSGALGLPSAVQTALMAARWPALVIILMLALSFLYKVAPDRRQAEWRWVSWGGAVATLLWLAASVGFSIYVSRFGSYNETYGAIGAVIILLMWLLITAYVVLLGAELNSELERQTARDTTGRRKPMGRREARAADSVGDVP